MRLLTLVLPAVFLTFALEYGLAMLAMRFTGVPKGFPPFTALPVLSGVIGGFVLATITYALVKLTSSDPNRTFLLIAIATLALSFSLPIRLSFTKSKRFAGVTPSAQMVLALMHTVLATSAVSVLTRSN
jgi:hypothetical protein